MSITVGVDIGGSHITSAGIDTDSQKIISGTLFRGNVDNKASKDSIFRDWGAVIDNTIEQLGRHDISGIGFAMPGPFNYNTGVAKFQRNDKYESLYGISISSELPDYLSKQNFRFRYLNDASSFAVGSSLIRRIKKDTKIIAITLGTGFGAAFLDHHIPQVAGKAVPEGGCLWDKPFLNSIADNYFSTRWFTSKYAMLTGNHSLKEVKDLVATKNDTVFKIFQEFADNLAAFLLPYLKTYNADLLIIGGSIAKSHHLFLPAIKEILQEKEVQIPIAISKNTEEANIIGASFLYNDRFWELVRQDLPMA